MKKELQRKLSFVLFVMAVFFAGTALTVFRDYIWMTCIAGVLLLATSVFYVLNQKEESTSPTEKTTELLMADRMAELMRGNEKAEKGVYIAVKKQHEAMENGMAALEAQIAELVKAQENAVKTLVMYNKENAKQMALSEREELGRLREELKMLQQGGTGDSVSPVVDAVREMSHRLYEELHEHGEALLSELESTSDSLEEIKTEMKGLKGAVPMAFDRSSMPMNVPAEAELAFEEMPEVPEPEQEAEPVEIPTYEAEPELEPLVLPEPEEEPQPIEEKPENALASSGLDLSDPNKTLSADDIAALFAQVNVSEDVAAEEPAQEEAVETLEFEDELPEVPEVSPVEEKPEDALASSGVDLSDPNKTLSADDIAALFAAMGN